MQRGTILLALACVHCATATPPPKQEPIAEIPAPPPEPIAIAPVEPPPPPEPPPPEPPPPPPPPRHYKALIIGDSMAATDFGVALQKQLDAHGQISCVRWGKSATGLARPDYFDWMKAGAKLVKSHSPDLVLVIIGGNDGQDLLAAKGKNGDRIFWKGTEWQEAYRARITGFLEVLMQNDRQVLWLELPLMDHRSLEEKLERIRGVQKSAVEAVEGATWIKTRHYFVDRRGRLVRKQKVEGWRAPQPLRQDDGIHFTVPGARFFAVSVVPDILSVLGL